MFPPRTGVGASCLTIQFALLKNRAVILSILRVILSSQWDSTYKAVRGESFKVSFLNCYCMSPVLTWMESCNSKCQCPPQAESDSLLKLKRTDPPGEQQRRDKAPPPSHDFARSPSLSYYCLSRPILHLDQHIHFFEQMVVSKRHVHHFLQKHAAPFFEGMTGSTV